MTHNEDEHTFDPRQVNHDALSTLRKESLDIFNRLHSIEEDIIFVNHVREHYRSFPLVPNLRCGAWYADPNLSSDIPAYFKSTDGHTGNWCFNLRRANLHLIPLVCRHSGLVLVDSTRAGKRMPDALSKTVPIWCSVVNRAIKIRRQRGLDSDLPMNWDCQLYTPPGIVSAQEHHRIAEKLDGWAKALADSSFEIPLDLPAPLRPLWITPSTTNFPSLDAISPSPKFLPIICVSASRQVGTGTQRREGGYAYVQGSGDDHELWGMGLTPSLFWRNRKDLVTAPRTNLEALIRQILGSASLTTSSSLSPSAISELNPQLTPIDKIHGRIQLSSFSPLDIDALSASLHLKAEEDSKMAYIILDFSHPSSPGEDAVADDIPPSTTPTPRVLHIDASPRTRGKSDVHFLQHVLPTAIPFVKFHLSQGSSNIIGVFEGCGNDSGTRLDISVGLILVAIQLLFDQNGEMVRDGRHHITQVDKQSIRKRLEWIIESEPRANPSRATLKRVNEYFLTPSAFLSQAQS